MPNWIVVTVAAAYGVVFGSFLNVVIHRLPRGMSLWRPRSHCPACNAGVRWFDNVPVVSYLVLAGRCRHCGSPISPRYPLVEVLTGVACGAVVWRHLAASEGGRGSLDASAWLGAGEGVVFVLLLIPLALIDLEHHILPDLLTLPGIALGLAWAATGQWILDSPRGALADFGDAAIGAVAGAAIPYAVIVAYRWLRGVEGMGLGDVKLLAMIGAFIGWRGMLLTLGLGAAGGAMVGIGLIATGRGQRDTELPFGTFLCAAAVVVLFYGGEIARVLRWVAVE